jgi:hypothetical protein
VRAEVLFVLTELQERIAYGLFLGVGFVVVFLAVVALVLYAAKRGWL